jgi:hypothetical protein
MLRGNQAAIQSRQLTRQILRTPRAAANAGVVFSFLMIAILWLIPQSVPPVPAHPS